MGSSQGFDGQFQNTISRHLLYIIAVILSFFINQLSATATECNKLPNTNRFEGKKIFVSVCSSTNKNNGDFGVKGKIHVKDFKGNIQDYFYDSNLILQPVIVSDADYTKEIIKPNEIDSMGYFDFNSNANPTVMSKVYFCIFTKNNQFPSKSKAPEKMITEHPKNLGSCQVLKVNVVK